MKSRFSVLSVVILLFVSACSDKPGPTDTGVQSSQEATAPMESEVSDEQQAQPEIAASGIDKSDLGWKQSLEQPDLMSFEAGKSYFWDMKTNKGAMSFRLFHQSAPMHVTSTVYLTENGFYDDVIFHRVIPGFMAQGGDPTGTGRGGPGYNYAGEFDGSTSHDRPGLLSMANAGPGTDGSQFFITFVPTIFLDGKHTIFGEIISGQETLAALEKVGSRSGKTSEMLQISKATIRIE